MKKNTILIIIVIFAGFWATLGIKHYLSVNSQEAQNRLKEQIKTELWQELNQEVGQLVKTEIDSYLSSKRLAKQQLSREEQLALSRQAEIPSETKQEAIERMVREIITREVRELSEQELDLFVAGDYTGQTALPSGLRKTPQRYEIAKASEIYFRHKFLFYSTSLFFYIVL